MSTKELKEYLQSLGVTGMSQIEPRRIEQLNNSGTNHVQVTEHLHGVGLPPLLAPVERISFSGWVPRWIGGFCLGVGLFNLLSVLPLSLSLGMLVMVGLSILLAIAFAGLKPGNDFLLSIVGGAVLLGLLFTFSG
jgi:hypothetical protein